MEARRLHKPKKRETKPSFVRMIVRVSILALFLYFILGGNYGLINLLSLKLQRDGLVEEIQLMKEETERLVMEKEELETDPKVIEKVAREKYGMIREGEKIYILITQN